MVDEVENSHDKTLEVLDRLEGIKRFILVIPVELAFIYIVVKMAADGQTTEAVAAAGGMFGLMVGYYFGKASA